MKNSVWSLLLSGLVFLFGTSASASEIDDLLRASVETETLNACLEQKIDFSSPETMAEMQKMFGSTSELLGADDCQTFAVLYATEVTSNSVANEETIRSTDPERNGEEWYKAAKVFLAMYTPPRLEDQLFMVTRQGSWIGLQNYKASQGQ